MNRYPLWKNLMVFGVVVISTIVALPNWFGDDEAVQLSRTDGVAMDAPALDKVRTNIQRYNAATNTPELLERGYHETMTQAWMQLVHCTLCEYGPAANADEFLDAQEHLLNRKALRFFYSHEQLISWRAKAEFVEPDLSPLPRSTKEFSPA